MYNLSVIVLMDKLNKDKIKMLNSLKKQTLKEIEMFCITDDPNDVKDYENIKVVEDFDKALECASGEYTAITNSNTFFEDKWAEKVYDYAKIDNEDMIICDLDIEDYKENTLKSFNLANIGNDINRIVILNWNLCNILFKTEKIKNIKLKMNNKYNELLFILETLTRCEKIGYAEDVKCYLYMKESEFNKIEIKDIEELKEVLKQVKETYKKENKYDEQYKDILSAIAFILLGVNSVIKLNSKQQELDIDIKEKEREIINFLDINFFEWRNNKILKSSFIKKELPYVWYANKMYRYGYIDLFNKLYKLIYRK